MPESVAASRHPPSATFHFASSSWPRPGKRVLRLKGGDPFMFGRGGEECQHLAEAGVPFRIVPGITAGVGGLAYAGMPATHRDTNHSVIFLTGHDASGKMPANVDWQAVAKASPVIVMYMAVKHLRRDRQRPDGRWQAARTIPSPSSPTPLCRTRKSASTTLGDAGAFVAARRAAHPSDRGRRPCLRLPRHA